MGSRWTYLCILGLTLAVVRLTEAQNCVAPAKTPEEIIPDIWDLASSSYQLLFESNYEELQKTTYVTETYNMLQQSGRLEVEEAGKKTSITYFSKTNEIFESTGSSCRSNLISDLDEMEFGRKYGAWNWINKDKKETIIGPSNMFKRALYEWNNGGQIGKQPMQEMVRGMQTNVWTWCYSNGANQATVKFYFTDPSQDNPYGLDGAVPIQVKASGTWQGTKFSHSFQYAGMRVNLPTQELNDLVSIPVSIGCVRKATGLPQAPNYEGKDMYVETELVYTPIVKNSLGFTYISNYKITVDQKNGVVAVQFSPWKSHGDSEVAKPGDSLFRVWDVINGFVFTTDKNTGECTVEKFKESFSVIMLPDGFKIDLADSDIFLMGADSQNFTYLQDTVERGIPASVFEKLMDKGDFDLNEMIVTRYHAANGTTLASQFNEKNAPLKVVYWRFNFQEGQFTGSLTANFYSYQSGLVKRQELFDVSPCFTADNKSKWVQIIFPLDDIKTSDVIPMIPIIENDYPSVIEKFGSLAVPYRIPKVIASIDQENLYLTALILERPDFLLDFNVTDKRKLSSAVEYQQELGISTLSDCAKSCLHEELCTYFMYCGALCTITTADYVSPEKILMQDGCTVYGNLYDILMPNVPTMDEVSKSIAAAVERKEVVLMMPDPSGQKVPQLTAEAFKDDIAFGLTGLNRKPEGMEEDVFKTFKMGFRIKKDMADEGQNVGRVSFPTCKQACLDKDGCETVSYCLASQECFLSGKHAEQIPSESMENSTQCMIISRSYLERFRHFPGLMLNHDAEKMLNVSSIELCAKACVDEKSGCESFDYCSKAASNCWLHKEHFTDMKENQHVTDSQECGHYSRRYVDEFTRTHHRDLSKVAGGLPVANITSERCAKLCRDNVNFDCQGFDFCSDPFSFASTCTLRGTFSLSAATEQTRCDIYSRKEGQAKNRDKREIVTEEGHSSSATGGLGFLMLLIGAVIGVGGVFGFAYYRANRNKS